jgi:hypothetical protein
MPIQSISVMYLGIGILFAVLLCVAVQAVVEQTTKLLVSEKIDPVNLLRPELEALKADLNALHLNRLGPELDGVKTDVNTLTTKLEMVTYSMRERANLATTSRALSEDTWSRDNSESQSIQQDPGSRGELATDIPTLGQSVSGDTWTRDEPPTDVSLVPTISHSTDEDTWTRNDSAPDSPDRDRAPNMIKVFSQEEHRTEVAPPALAH